MERRENTPEEQALLDFYTELMKLSDDDTVGGRFIFLSPEGVIVANGSLAPTDIAAATIALQSLNRHRKAMQDIEESGMTVSLPAVDEDVVADVITGFEKFLGGE